MALEILTAWIDAMEKQVAAQRAKSARTKDWRKTVGIFAGNEFIEQLDATVAEMREAERRAARHIS
ncbi:MAG: hypothetical protein JNK93_13125 [Planctomycetia bacterium]|nr:hypothetical protein [Planctomycetia bacterium]